jgi:transcriptional regulator with GAF, ATPase, and Fis domain
VVQIAVGDSEETAERALAGSPFDSEDEDLASGLASLARLSVTGSSLEEVLTDIASYAVRAIPHADGAGLTLLEAGRADTIVKTAPFVKQVDDIQYGLGEGPCIAAAAHGQPVRSGSMGSDERWPRFGPRANALGVHSVLSLPLCTPDGVVGAMNVYAHGRDVFDQRAEDLGMLFAVPAAVAVQNAHTLARTTRLATRLQAALNGKAEIDQAIGILRSRSGISAVEAHRRLRTLSQNEHSKVSEVAAAIITTAVNRAQQRPAEPE